ncbi:MAG: hypothetical protein CME59_00755 [Halioglobus sp.]|nr:hypothetical protein [Halioglobus sp.]|tara:strand:+ start:2808 stop:3065 length:258 start_codon:yes stop_codon:yes gene_type:complete
MGIPARRWLIAIGVAFYLYFLLPATAAAFYELYHLTHIDAVYWGYSGFKAAGYYFGVWEYRELTCLGLAAAILLLPTIITRLRRA